MALTIIVGAGRLTCIDAGRVVTCCRAISLTDGPGTWLITDAGNIAFAAGPVKRPKPVPSIRRPEPKTNEFNSPRRQSRPR